MNLNRCRGTRNDPKASVSRRSSVVPSKKLYEQDEPVVLFVLADALQAIEEASEFDVALVLDGEPIPIATPPPPTRSTLTLIVRSPGGRGSV